jgi:hypothetical protein
MWRAGATRWLRFLRDACGASGLSVGLGLGTLAVVVTGGMSAGLETRLVERTVCIFDGLRVDGAAGCEGGDVHLAQDRQGQLSRAEIRRRLDLELQRLNEYWRNARRLAGRPAHSDPFVMLEDNRDLMPYSFVALPPFAGRQVPWIELSVGDSGDPEEDLAQAIFRLAHMFAQAGQHDPAASDRRDDQRLTSGVDVWICRSDCARVAARTRLADCMAGAYARAAGIDAAVVRRMRERLRTTHPLPSNAATGFPEGTERVRLFDRGYDSPDPSNPYAACETAPEIG